MYTTDTVYDALNRITELELPEDLDGERKKIKPTYNTAGALEQVNLISPNGGSPVSTNYVENIAYNAKGQRLLIAFGNNRMTRYTYDPRTFRLQRQRTEGYSKSVAGDTMTYAYTSGTNKQDDGFNYDLAGNIVNIFTRVTDCGIQGSIPGKDALNREFGYDALYRLTFADGREADTQSGNSYLYDDAPAPGTPNANNVRSYERTYNYDKLGNMLSVVQADVNGFTREYTYNPSKNTLQKIEDGSSSVLESYSYDSCGNTLNSSLNRKYTWNHADQLICYKNQVGSGTPTVYAQYDYAGQDRVSKMVRTGSHYERTIYIDGIFEYVWYDDGTLYQKNYIHVMDDTSRIAEIRVGDVFPTDINDSITYILEDQIGSSVMRLSISGTVIDEEEYYPFGDSSLRTFTYKRYRYVGKEKDAESGLYYYGARYYTAWTCRFISVDPLAGKYAQLSPYNYADNNPINDYDIDGMQNNNSDNSQQSQNQQNGQQPNTQNGQPYNPYASSGIQTRTTPKPAGRWGRIACDACELDVLRNNPNAMNIGTEGKIFYAPGVDVTGRMIWVKPQITPNINTVVTTTPTGPGIVGNPIGPPAALQVPVNFNSGTNVLAPTGGAAINNAVTALNVQGGVFQPNGNPITVVGPTSQPVPATDLMSESTNQVTISNQPGQVAGQTTMFTLDLSTARQQTPQATALLNARYNTIRGQMIAAGVPAANISMGTLRYGQTAAQMGGDPNNSTTFRAQQFQVNTPAIQTTTTTTITNYTY